MLRRIADGCTIVGLLVLVIALVTTTGALAVVGAVLVAVSIVLALIRRALASREPKKRP